MIAIMALFQGFTDLQRFVRREQKTIMPNPQTINQPTSTIPTNSISYTNIPTPITTDDKQTSPLSTDQTIYSLDDIIAAIPNTSAQQLPPSTDPVSSISPTTQSEPSKPEVINLDALLSGLEKTWNIQAPDITKPKNTIPFESHQRLGRSAKARGITMIAGGILCLGGLLYFYIITTNPLLFEDTSTTTQAAQPSNVPSIADSLTQPATQPKKTMTALTPFEEAIGANDAETTINVLDIMDLLENDLTTIQNATGTEKRLQSTATMLLKNLHTARTVLDESPQTPNWDEIKDILTRIQSIYQNTILGNTSKQ